MSGRFLAFSLALRAPCAAVAAPAPPVRLVTAEAVVKTPRGDPRGRAARAGPSRGSSETRPATPVAPAARKTGKNADRPQIWIEGAAAARPV
jgi:hypothetical protein